MKIIAVVLAGVVLLGLGFYALNSYIYNEKQAESEFVADYKAAEFLIDGEWRPIGEELQYFGNELVTDVNGDELDDVVFLVTYSPGGSGTFFYVVAAVKTSDGYMGTDGYLLGDRIAPQTTERSQNPRHQNVVVVNYADRAIEEPMTAMPSVGKSAYLKLDTDGRWGIVDVDYTGAADVERMTLNMKTWEWQRTDYSDGQIVTPNQAGVFTLAFADDGMVAIGTDCNQVGGEYQIENGQIAFVNIFMTKMYCEGSQETDFVSALEDIVSYQFTNRGELLLQQANEVTMILR